MLTALRAIYVFVHVRVRPSSYKAMPVVCTDRNRQRVHHRHVCGLYAQGKHQAVEKRRGKENPRKEKFLIIQSGQVNS